MDDIKFRLCWGEPYNQAEGPGPYKLRMPFPRYFAAHSVVETHATKWHKNKACRHAVNEKLATS